MRSRNAALARSSSRASQSRPAGKFPSWSGQSSRIEFEENTSNSDTGWTVGYVDVLLLLVTLFAALLGMTYLQQPAHRDEPSPSADSELPTNRILTLEPLPSPHTTLLQLPNAPWSLQNPLTVEPIMRDRSTTGLAVQPSAEPAVTPTVLDVQATAAPAPEPEIPAEFAQMMQWLAQHEDYKDLDLLLDQNQLRIEVGNEILFPSGSASLSSSGKKLLADLTGLLLDNTLTISVEGHTDDVPISTPRFPSNWELSSLRATAVAHELITLGIAQQRLRVTAYADTRPRMPNDSAANRALNRRVSLVLDMADQGR